MDVYVNGLESVIFSMQMCILQTRALCKGGSHGTEIGICEALRDLVPFEQFKKREKYPWRTVTFSKVTCFNLQLY